MNLESSLALSEVGGGVGFGGRRKASGLGGSWLLGQREVVSKGIILAFRVVGRAHFNLGTGFYPTKRPANRLISGLKGRKESSTLLPRGKAHDLDTPCNTPCPKKKQKTKKRVTFCLGMVEFKDLGLGTMSRMGGEAHDPASTKTGGRVGCPC